MSLLAQSLVFLLFFVDISDQATFPYHKYSADGEGGKFIDARHLKPLRPDVRVRDKNTQVLSRGSATHEEAQSAASHKNSTQRTADDIPGKSKLVHSHSRQAWGIGANANAYDATSGRKSKQHRRFLSNVRKKLKQHINKEAEWGLSNKEAEELFNKYNECLEQKVKALETEEFPIKPIMAIEGEKIVMDCLVWPDMEEGSQRATWQLLKHEETELENVEEGKNMKISKNNTLTIQSIDINDAGQYFCVEHQDYAAVYQVDVFLTDRWKHISHGVDVPQGDTFLLQRNLRVFTMWAPWGDCNSCDRPGQRFRVGQCTVKKIYSDTPVFPRDYPILMFYKDGVPCHSTALPKHMRQIPEIGQRYSETLVASCNETCPTQPPSIEITDKNGEVVDVIEPGFHSVHQKLALPPLIKRKVLYEPQGSHLVLHCPGELEVPMIHWTRGERQIDPGSIKRQTHGRVTVDSRNQLHITQLLLSDTAVYKYKNNFIEP